jgi:hypothetical protein
MSFDGTKAPRRLPSAGKLTTNNRDRKGANSDELVRHNENNKETVLYKRQHNFVTDKITYQSL